MKLKLIVGILASVLLASCSTEPLQKSWVFNKTIAYEGVNPIGIAQTDTGLWLSDGDHNRVVSVNDQGGIITEISNLERPMHIDGNRDVLYVPQYGNDEVFSYAKGERFPISPKDSLDAPAGVSVYQNEIAIADFYNHKIHYSKDGSNWITFGTEGKAAGQFYYPTDVQLTANKIWVADAYNNRIQEFDKEGKSLNVIGEAEKMNASTGIYVSGTSVFITDFENNRVLVYDLQGALQQEIKTGILKPTDILLRNNQLIIANYGSSSLSVYDWKVAPKKEEDHHDHGDSHEHHDDQTTHNSHDAR